MVRTKDFSENIVKLEILNRILECDTVKETKAVYQMTKIAYNSINIIYFSKKENPFRIPNCFNASPANFMILRLKIFVLRTALINLTWFNKYQRNIFFNLFSSFFFPLALKLCFLNLFIEFPKLH